MLIAVNRYFRVVRPTLYRSIYSKKTSATMAVTAGIVSAVTVGVSFYVLGIQYQPYPANPTILLPVFLSRNAATFFVLLYSIIIGVHSFIIIICSVKIYQTIRHHNTAAAPSSQGGHSFLWSRRGEDYENSNSCFSWLLYLLVAPFCY